MSVINVIIGYLKNSVFNPLKSKLEDLKNFFIDPSKLIKEQPKSPDAAKDIEGKTNMVSMPFKAAVDGVFFFGNFFRYKSQLYPVIGSIALLGYAFAAASVIHGHQMVAWLSGHGLQGLADISVFCQNMAPYLANPAGLFIAITVGFTLWKMVFFFAVGDHATIGYAQLVKKSPLKSILTLPATIGVGYLMLLIPALGAEKGIITAYAALISGGKPLVLTLDFFFNTKKSFIAKLLYFIWYPIKNIITFIRDLIWFAVEREPVVKKYLDYGIKDISDEKFTEKASITEYISYRAARLRDDVYYFISYTVLGIIGVVQRLLKVVLQEFIGFVDIFYSGAVRLIQLVLSVPLNLGKIFAKLFSAVQELFGYVVNGPSKEKVSDEYKTACDDFIDNMNGMKSKGGIILLSQISSEKAAIREIVDVKAQDGSAQVAEETFAGDGDESKGDSKKDGGQTFESVEENPHSLLKGVYAILCGSKETPLSAIILNSITGPALQLARSLPNKDNQSPGDEVDREAITLECKYVQELINELKGYIPREKSIYQSVTESDIPTLIRELRGDILSFLIEQEKEYRDEMPTEGIFIKICQTIRSDLENNNGLGIPGTTGDYAISKAEVEAQIGSFIFWKKYCFAEKNKNEIEELNLSSGHVRVGRFWNFFSFGWLGNLFEYGDDKKENAKNNSGEEYSTYFLRAVAWFLLLAGISVPTTYMAIHVASPNISALALGFAVAAVVFISALLGVADDHKDIRLLSRFFAIIPLIIASILVLPVGLLAILIAPFEVRKYFSENSVIFKCANGMSRFYGWFGNKFGIAKQESDKKHNNSPVYGLLYALFWLVNNIFLHSIKANGRALFDSLIAYLSFAYNEFRMKVAGISLGKSDATKKSQQKKESQNDLSSAYWNALSSLMLGAGFAAVCVFTLPANITLFDGSLMTNIDKLLLVVSITFSVVLIGYLLKLAFSNESSPLKTLLDKVESLHWRYKEKTLRKHLKLIPVICVNLIAVLTIMYFAAPALIQNLFITLGLNAVSGYGFSGFVILNLAMVTLAAAGVYALIMCWPFIWKVGNGIVGTLRLVTGKFKSSAKDEILENIRTQNYKIDAVRVGFLTLFAILAVGGGILSNALSHIANSSAIIIVFQVIVGLLTAACIIAPLVLFHNKIPLFSCHAAKSEISIRTRAEEFNSAAARGGSQCCEENRAGAQP